MNSATVLAQKQATNAQAIRCGGLVAATLDALDGEMAFGKQGLRPINGVIGHALFVGLPISLSARRVE